MVKTVNFTEMVAVTKC